MKILKEITIDSYLNLLNSDNNTFRKYYSEDMDFDSDEYRSLFTQEELMLDILGINDLSIPELIISSEPKDDFENSKRIFEWLDNLSIGDANDPRFWTTLTHLYYEQYTRIRWKIDKKTTNETIKQRYFYSGGGLQARLRNSISRLWWIAKLTAREDLQDKYVYTEIVWSSQDLMQNLFERSLGTYSQIKFGMLRFYLEKKGMFDTKQFRVFYKEINALGAMSPLGLLTEDEVFNFLSKVENVYYPNLNNNRVKISENQSINIESQIPISKNKHDVASTSSNTVEISSEIDYNFLDVNTISISDSDGTTDLIQEKIKESVIYVKKINSQDLERTPSISSEAVTKFLKIDMLNDQEIELKCTFKGQELAIGLKKRNTRDEYRLFLNKHRELIGYDKNDLMIFSYNSGELNLEIIKRSFSISQNPRYNDYHVKLGNKYHLLL